MRASYLHAYETGDLKKKIDRARRQLGDCRLCPHECSVDRIGGETGVCETGINAIVSSFGPHFGEESVLVGRYGSGTIFFGSCNLYCVFCQNYDISHRRVGAALTPPQIAQRMLSLQQRGCHNINFVSPSHVVTQILQALLPAIEGGLDIPLVYNTGGYDSVDTLGLLDGIFDIYMPDIKFLDPAIAGEYCRAPDYPEAVTAAVSEMHRQVGDLVTENGIAKKGLLVRHLAMPNDQSTTSRVMKFIAGLSINTYINIMAQYRPMFQTSNHPKIDLRPTGQEIRKARKIAMKEGLTRLD